jgi:hypothetical protein
VHPAQNILCENTVVMLQEDLTAEQCSFFQYEDSSPDCLMELRFLDSQRRVEGARYIADKQLDGEMATVLARAIKEQQRRGDTATGFSSAAGDCLAFKYYRDAQECRNMKERQQYIGTAAVCQRLACFQGHQGV